MGTCGHLTLARDTAGHRLYRSIFHIHTPRSFNISSSFVIRSRLRCCTFSEQCDLVPTQKVPHFLTQLLRLINGLNAVICGENLARFRPINGTVDQVNQHRDDFINIADQLSGRVAFPSKVVAVERPRLARQRLHMDGA